MPASSNMDLALGVAPSADLEALLRTALGLDKNANRADRNRAAALLQPCLFAVAFAVAKRFPQIDAYDCALEAVQVWWCFAAAFAFSKYDPKRPLWPYAGQSLRYMAIGLALARQRLSLETVDNPELTEIGDDPREIAEQREPNMKLFLAVQQLPSHMQAAIGMRFEHNMMLCEIAQKLGVSKPTVCRWIKKALAKLRNELSDSCP